MFKNQLQELAQRSCFNLPSYACIREGPDHAPRFKASVNFNGEIFESPSYCSTLRQAEHSAAEVALNVLSSRGPSRSLTARVLDETGVYKNLLQETAHRAGLNLPVYTTIRSGPGHVPIFTCTVEIAGMNFTGDPAKTKKQAEKNAAIAAWSALKRMRNVDFLAYNKEVAHEDQDQAVVARVLSNFRSKDEFKQQARRRDYSQARRRMVRSYRDHHTTSSAASSSSSVSNYSNANNSLNYQQWKLLDLLLDSALDNSTKKHNSFVSLLPPPPPRTSSKILLPPPPASDNPSIPALYPSIKPTIHHQNKGKQAKEIPVPFDEHRKDEEEWLGISKKSSCSISSSSSSNGNPSNGYDLFRQVPRQESSIPQIGSGIFGSSSIKNHSNFYSGMLYSHRIAPAVQIRSVIPVCAAPPSPSPSQAAISTTKNSKSTAAEGTTTKVNKESTSSSSDHQTQLSSTEFNKKLQI